MKRIKMKVILSSLSALLMLNATKLFAGGEEGVIPDKVSLENLSGMFLTIAKLYNDDKIVFAIVVTATMAIVGVLIGYFTELILKMLGMDVSKIAHHE